MIFTLFFAIPNIFSFALTEESSGVGGNFDNYDIPLDNFTITEFPQNFTSTVRPALNFTTKDYWKTLTNSSYDMEAMPEMQNDKPLTVNVSIFVHRLHSVSEATMDYGIDIYYREEWIDSRLQFDPYDYQDKDYFSVAEKEIERLWKPDSYFPNAMTTQISEKGSVTHRTHLRLRSNGTVWYSRRISLKGDCPMDLSFYPFDQQACILSLTSYGLTADKMEYKWAASEAVAFGRNVMLPEFSVNDYKYTARVLKYSTGNYSSVKLCIILWRSAGFCLLQLVFPAAAVVVSSWVALWLEEETQFNDIIAVILAIIFLSYSQNSVLPKVSYIKLMDVYLATCFLFVFFSLSKLVLLKYMRRNWERKRTDIGSEVTWNERWNKAQAFHRTQQENDVDAGLRAVKGFHVITQMLLPILFALFVCVVVFLLPQLEPKGLCED